MKRNCFLLFLPFLFLSLTSCKKEYLDTSSPTSITDELAFSNYKSGLQVLNGVLAKYYYYGNGGQGKGGIGVMGFHARLDMFGDDVINTMISTYMSYYRWDAIADERTAFVSEAWDFYYDKIKVLNNLIGKLDQIKDATQEEKDLIEGEARILRAYAYHQLVQMYGKRYTKGGANDALGVVLRDENSTLDPMPRSTVGECYNFIVKDLERALILLKGKQIPPMYTNNWVGSTTAYAIAARVYQSMSEWEKVEECTKLSLDAAKVEGFGLATPVQLLAGFNDATNPEWIWGYKIPKDQYVGYNSFFCAFGYAAPSSHPQSCKLAVNRDIYDKMGPNDCRRKWWYCEDLGSVPPAGSKAYIEGNGGAEPTGASLKFNVSSINTDFPGDNLVMRLAVVYYMRAEALARLGKDGEAQEVLNEIMVTRDPDYSAAAFTGDELIAEVLRNKRIDLWLEGERFFDMKRLGVVPDRINSKNIEITKTLRPANYETAQKRNSRENIRFIPKDAESPNWEFMIPLEEMEGAHGKVVQNPQHVQR